MQLIESPSTLHSSPALVHPLHKNNNVFVTCCYERQTLHAVIHERTDQTDDAQTHTCFQISRTHLPEEGEVHIQRSAVELPRVEVTRNNPGADRRAPVELGLVSPGVLHELVDVRGAHDAAVARRAHQGIILSAHRRSSVRSSVLRVHPSSLVRRATAGRPKDSNRGLRKDG